MRKDYIFEGINRDGDGMKTYLDIYLSSEGDAWEMYYWFSKRKDLSP